MNILYVALKEALPGSHGGSVHVLEVARQLTRRGHRVTVLVRQEPAQAASGVMDGFELVRMPVRSNYLLFQLEPQVREILIRQPTDVVMERYYNFAGAGLRAADGAKLPSVLEVNAPLVDPPGTKKDIADRVLLNWITRRARAQARLATRIVTPLAATIPFPEARDKIREIPWGANVELFDPARVDAAQEGALRAEINPQHRRVVVFLGSFRPWHGVRELVRVATAMVQARDDVMFLLIGAGELFDELRTTVASAGLQERIRLVGAVPYDKVPNYLALADVGVAPFNTTVHPPLRVGFYWSPLKVHEYMAMRLPVVAPDLAGLNEIARADREGLLYPENDLPKLRAAIERLVDDPILARRLGDAGRVRVVEQFSWQRHAERLEQVLNECRSEVQ